MVDRRAASGFAAAAQAYERGRPGYPPEAIDLVVGALALTRQSRVLDLAAGTGQVARAFRGFVGELVAVEPVAEMRDTFSTVVPEVTILSGTAEAIPLDDRAVTAVVVGEAFHWFDTTTAAVEIARVLRPPGGLALLWNVPTWTPQDTPWLPAFRDLVAQHREAAGSFPAGDGQWQGRLADTGLFGPVHQAEAHHEQRLDTASFVSPVASWSWIANLGDAQRRSVLADIESLLTGQPEIVIPYRTEIYWTRRRAGGEPGWPA